MERRSGHITHRVIALAGLLVAPPLGADPEVRRLSASEQVAWHVLPTAPATRLVVLLHGCAQSPEALLARGGLAAHAETHRAELLLPAVPEGGVVAGCWAYYGEAHAVTSPHVAAVLAWIARVDAGRGLPVAVAGLSSGAGEALVLGCLRPDLFAGVGLVAGPGFGTGALETTFVATTAERAARGCLALAGERAGAFAAQRAAVVAGDADRVVAPGYLAVHVEMFTRLYGSLLAAEALDVSALPGHAPRGAGALHRDATSAPRLSAITVAGMGHAFPAGTGPGPELDFVASEGPAWLDHFLTLTSPSEREDAGVLDVDADAGVLDVDADAGPADAGSVELQPSGCGCGSTRGPRAGAWLALAIVLTASRARRGRARAPRTGPPARGPRRPPPRGG